MSQNKKNELLQCYLSALENYCKKKPRKGCIPTFFTHYRHSFKEYPALYRLRESLVKEQNIISALTLVIDHFISNAASFNNHSFNNYFMDELRNSASFSNIDWDCFTPKAVKYYTGTLYRGDTRSPSIIFDSGFKERTSSDFDSSYLKYYTGTTGISSSKDIDVAINYAMPKENRLLKYLRALLKYFKYERMPTYVYAINYRGSDGFDILKTGQARGLNFSSVFHVDRMHALKDKEVNIKGFVSPECILGVYQSIDGRSWLWTENPKYMLNMQKEEARNNCFPANNLSG